VSRSRAVWETSPVKATVRARGSQAAVQQVPFPLDFRYNSAGNVMKPAPDTPASSSALVKHASLRAFGAELGRQFPYLARVIDKRLEAFGAPWADEFDRELDTLFRGQPEHLAQATKGYAMFSLDAMRLQKKFEKTRRYEAKTYEQAGREVYHNREYMLNLYLPGILLSHYLWPHHYRQLQFFRREYLPLVTQLGAKIFYDVGVGTGFYSRQMLSGIPDIRGVGFDISEHSMAYTRSLISGWGHASRYEIRRQNIIEEPIETPAPSVISVEVLEHLEHPIPFLRGVAHMLSKDGVGFITAALTAPNADHIYLYNNVDEVISQLDEAGLRTNLFQEEIAYEPKAGEPVPRVAAFIVRHKRPE
jgi:2-polyprenyl-3-methyl-5-hydroxy-6-metoxy-1,4-benzoquinol methylase